MSQVFIYIPTPLKNWIVIYYKKVVNWTSQL